MSYTIEPTTMSPDPVLWSDAVSAKEHRALPFSRFYEELAPAFFEARTAPVRIVTPRDDAHAGRVVESPVVLVGTFDPEAVVALPRPKRMPAAISAYEEILIQLDPAELIELLPEPEPVVLRKPEPVVVREREPVVVPEPEAVLVREPAPVVLLQPESVRAAEDEDRSQTWDPDRELDGVIQDWFDKPLPEPPADMGGEIILH